MWVFPTLVTAAARKASAALHQDTTYSHLNSPPFPPSPCPPTHPPTHPPAPQVSSHRYHHLHCDTPLDPHSPYEGFWWSHMGWLLDHTHTDERVCDRTNASDLAAQPFYVHLAKHYVWHVVAQFAVLYALGGLPAVVWGGALRVVWVYHITWFVNSAAHVWGNQTYNTGAHGAGGAGR